MTAAWKSVLKFYIAILGYPILVIGIDYDSLVAADDFLNYYDAYQRVEFDGGFAQFGTDWVILIYYSFLHFFFGNLDQTNFLAVHFFLPYLLAATALYRVSRGPVMLLVMLVFFDAYLSNHLARQLIASAFIIFALEEYFSRRRIGMMAFFLALAYFSHSTAPIFFLAGVVFGHLQPLWLRILILVGAVLAITGSAVQHLSLLELTQGTPVLGKAFFALVLFQENGVSSPRLFATIGAAIFVILPPTRWYEKITAGFLALTLMVYPVPILNTRIGLIGTSIFIGVPYWMLLKCLLRWVAPKRNPATE